jgi:hypothetical protein
MKILSFVLVLLLHIQVVVIFLHLVLNFGGVSDETIEDYLVKVPIGIFEDLKCTDGSYSR